MWQMENKMPFLEFTLGIVRIGQLAEDGDVEVRMGWKIKVTYNWMFRGTLGTNQIWSPSLCLVSLKDHISSALKYIKI